MTLELRKLVAWSDQHEPTEEELQILGQFLDQLRERRAEQAKRDAELKSQALNADRVPAELPIIRSTARWPYALEIGGRRSIEPGETLELEGFVQKLIKGPYALMTTCEGAGDVELQALHVDGSELTLWSSQEDREEPETAATLRLGFGVEKHTATFELSSFFAVLSMAQRISAKVFNPGPQRAWVQVTWLASMVHCEDSVLIGADVVYSDERSPNPSGEPSDVAREPEA